MTTTHPNPPVSGAPPARVWAVGARRSLALDRARVIAILNVTPDSFSDGGALPTVEGAVGAARGALAAGADMLDIGAESTRPGALRVGAEEQVRRLAPVVRAIREAGVDAPISVDTTLCAVARAALDAGADAVNDVSAGMEDSGMLRLCAEREAGLVLMHRLCSPGDDRFSDNYGDAPPDYGDESAGGGVVRVVREFLRERAKAALAAGVRADAIALDPGLGFGKTVEQNHRLIASSAALCSLGYPMMGGASRKSFVGRVSGVEAARERVAGSIAASVAQRLGGFLLFRVHDVAAQTQALRVADRVARAADPTV